MSIVSNYQPIVSNYQHYTIILKVTHCNYFNKVDQTDNGQPGSNLAIYNTVNGIFEELLVDLAFLNLCSQRFFIQYVSFDQEGED